MSISPRRIARFGAVGIAAALFYLTGVFLLTAIFHANPTVASMLAYGLSGVFSYAAQRSFTFASTGRHRVEAPRFLALAAVGLAICGGLPAVLTQALRLPSGIAVAAACVAVPALNYLVMERVIFTPARRRSLRVAPRRLHRPGHRLHENERVSEDSRC